MPIFVAPLAGIASVRLGARPVLVAGLALMAVGLGWLAAVSSVTVANASLLPPFMISGIGTGLFFAPIANVVLSAVPKEDEGVASGANNTIRELGGVFGVAVLAAVFSAEGSYVSPQTYVDGVIPAVAAGAAVVALAPMLATALLSRRPACGWWSPRCTGRRGGRDGRARGLNMELSELTAPGPRGAGPAP
jgi:MFS family permease